MEGLGGTSEGVGRHGFLFQSAAAVGAGSTTQQSYMESLLGRGLPQLKDLSAAEGLQQHGMFDIFRERRMGKRRRKRRERRKEEEEEEEEDCMDLEG